MRTSIWTGGSVLLLLVAAVAVGKEPAKAPDGPLTHGPRVIVQAVEGQPGRLRVEVTPRGPQVLRVEKAAGKPGKPGERREGAKPVKVGDYWIGLQCYAVEDALRSQLKLAEGQGVVIESIVPDSPAAKAGLKRHDVLVKAAGKPIGELADLVEAVEKAKKTKLSLDLIREGKAKKIVVTPAKRPKGAGPGSLWHGLPMPGNPDLEVFRKWHEQFRPGAAPPMRYRFFQPGIILPPGARVTPRLPSNMSVAITRRGNEPARIVVQKGDQKWEVTEKTLGKLPKDVRPHVERMLGRLPNGEQGDVDIDVDVLRPAPRVFGPSPDRQLKRQLDQMNRQIEELRKAVAEMHGKAQRPKDKNK